MPKYLQGVQSGDIRSGFRPKGEFDLYGLLRGNQITPPVPYERMPEPPIDRDKIYGTKIPIPAPNKRGPLPNYRYRESPLFRGEEDDRDFVNKQYLRGVKRITGA
jgi:hypothetical protein